MAPRKAKYRAPTLPNCPPAPVMRMVFWMNRLSEWTGLLLVVVVVAVVVSMLVLDDMWIGIVDCCYDWYC